MWKFVVLLFCLMIGLYFIEQSVFQNNDRYILLRGGRILDSCSGRYVSGDEILIKGNVIEAIGKSLARPADVEIIDLNGMSILPGLIDSHTHILFFEKDYDFDFSKGLIRNDRENNDAQRYSWAIKRAREFLMAGITTIRDLGNSGRFLDLKLKKEIEAKKIIGPRMFVSGPGLATGSAQFPCGTERMIVEKEYSVVETVSDVEEIISEYVEKGVDLIKVYSDNNPGCGKMSLELMKKVVSEAHRVGLKVSVHAEEDESVRRAVMAGVDIIEHGYRINKDTVRIISERKVWLVPTDFSNKIYEFILKVSPSKKQNLSEVNLRKKRFKDLLESEVLIIAGSDMYMDLSDHGESIGEFAKEVLYSYSESGMKNSDIIKSATCTPGKLLGRKNRLGILNKGAFADIIAVDGDPLDDIRALMNIRFVMKDGEIIKK